MVVQNPSCPKCNIKMKRSGSRNKSLSPRFHCPECGEVYVLSRK